MRALVFDLDGTLLQYTAAYRDLLATTFETVSGRVEDDWLDSYGEAFFEEFAACNPRPVQRAFAGTGAPGEPEEFARRLHEAEVAATEPPAHALQDLEGLAGEYSLAVLTNGLPEWQRGKLAAHGLDGPVDTVVTSYDVGAHKPETAPFEEVERRLGADRYAMIGDSDDDVDGAAAAGWASVRYDGGRLAELPGTLAWE